jgi:hypothetical protein
MINKFKIFINDNSNIDSNHKLEIQGKLDIKNIEYHYDDKILNDYLTVHYIVNKDISAYYDIIVTDKELNILFGRSINNDKFKYSIPDGRIPSKKTFEIVNNKTKEAGLVDETGRKIIIEPKFLKYRDEDYYWLFYNGEFTDYELLTLVKYDGTILTKDNIYISHI